MSERKTRSEEVAETRAKVREWLKDLQDRFHVKPVQIARDAGVHPATVYRMLRMENDAGLDTVMRIADFYHVPPPGATDTSAGVFDFLQDAPPPPSAHEEKGQWLRVSCRALELAGVLPGDLALIDRDTPARAGDIVLAEIFDFLRGRSDARLRYFDGRYLQTRTLAHDLEEPPVMVDGERARIVGRVERIVRNMR